MRSRWRATARSEDGFGLLELLIALMVLSVGLFAMLDVFTSAKLSLTRTDEIATAAVIADQQMERFRALEWSAVALNAASYDGADSVYKADAAYPPKADAALADAVGPCYTLDPSNQWCRASRTVSGTSNPPSPDGRSYRIDTFVDFWTPAVVSPYRTPDRQRRVTIVVRDLNAPGMRTLARETSIFDSFTGSVDANSPQS